MSIIKGHSFLARLAVPSAALLSLLLSTACRAPGMKMDMEAKNKPATYLMNGQRVTLHPLNAQAVLDHGSALPTTAGIDLWTGKTEPYKVGSQDVLLITVWDHPELTLPLGQYRTDNAAGTNVDEEGYIFYPYIGRVKVGGLTLIQVRDTLTERLNRVLQKPQVDVKVLAFRSQKVYVGGEVRLPATYNITDLPFTLAEAVNRAGGFLPSADQSALVLSRGDRSWTLNFQDLLARGNRIDKILLKDGDSLLVRHRDETPVYVLGEVRNARTIPTVNGRMSLAQALSDAGGISTTSADPRSIYVLRRGKAENAVDVFHLDAYNPVAMVMADRFALQPRDIVYVDAGTLVRWNRVLNLLLPTTGIFTSIPTIITDSKSAF